MNSEVIRNKRKFKKVFISLRASIKAMIRDYHNQGGFIEIFNKERIEHISLKTEEYLKEIKFTTKKEKREVLEELINLFSYFYVLIFDIKNGNPDPIIYKTNLAYKEDAGFEIMLVQFDDFDMVRTMDEDLKDSPFPALLKLRSMLIEASINNNKEEMLNSKEDIYVCLTTAQVIRNKISYSDIPYEDLVFKEFERVLDFETKIMLENNTKEFIDRKVFYVQIPIDVILTKVEQLGEDAPKSELTLETLRRLEAINIIEKLIKDRYSLLVNDFSIVDYIKIWKLKLKRNNKLPKDTKWLRIVFINLTKSVSDDIKINLKAHFEEPDFTQEGFLKIENKDYRLTFCDIVPKKEE